MSRFEVAPTVLHNCSLLAVEGSRVLRSIFSYCQLRIYTTYSISRSQLSSILQFSMSAYCAFSVTGYAAGCVTDFVEYMINHNAVVAEAAEKGQYALAIHVHGFSWLYWHLESMFG